MESLKSKNFKFIRDSVRIYSLDYPKIKAIAFVGPEESLEDLPPIIKCRFCGKDWTYFCYEELNDDQRTRFDLKPGERVEIQVLEDNRF